VKSCGYYLGCGVGFDLYFYNLIFDFYILAALPRYDSTYYWLQAFHLTRQGLERYAQLLYD